MTLRLLALVAVLSCSPVLAQTLEGVPDRPIARAEVQAAVKRQFAVMDANHDGFVSRAEFEAYRARTSGASSQDPFGHVGSHWFEHADTRGDGRVTLAEAQARPLQLFDTVDLNHDGVVSLQERKMASILLALHGK